jgi:AcrR family transcriptional regulator
MSAIRAAALELFARQGYHSTSISQIAKEAGVSKGLLYNYFASKEVLLEDIILGALGAADQLTQQLESMEGGPSEQLRWLTEATFATVQENLPYWKLMAALAMQADQLEAIKPLLKEKEEQNVRLIAAIFEQLGAKQPREMAYYYGAVLDGVMLHYMQLGEGYPIGAMKNLVLKQFIPNA